MFVLTILSVSEINYFYSSAMKPCVDALKFVNHKHALLLRHSKTDQYNQGKIIPISGELSEMISSWSLAIDQDSGYILRSFKRNLSTKSSLTPASINHILKSLQKQAGLNQIGELSGHSFRVALRLTY